MRVGRGDAERLRGSRPPPHPSGLRPATFPPVGGRLGARSNREEFGLLWDVWIHILGIGAKCACWKAGGPVCRPYGGNVVSPGGAPCRVVCGRRAGEDTRPYGDCGRKTVGAQCAPLHGEEREPAPSSAPFGGTFPPGGRHDGRVGTPAPTEGFGQKWRAHNVRPYSAIINGSTHKKRDRF